MSVPRYEEYRDSGVEWLGRIPAHWEVVRLKRVTSVSPSNVDKKAYDGEVPVRLCNYTDVYYNDVILPDMEFMEATASRDQVARFTLRRGDVIITKDSETADDIAIAAYVPHDMPGIVTGYHLAVVRPREGTSGAFLKRLFDSAFVRSTVAVRANGLTRVGLSQYALDNLTIPLPPESEQQSIADFLDRETRTIDTLIAEQQRLIELLMEKRHGVVSHVVTKGLNSDVPMKDSGVEWLGEVPAHWATTKLGYFLSAPPCYGVLVPDHDADGIRMLRITDMQDGVVRHEALATISRALSAQYSRTIVDEGDVVLSVVGTIGQALRVDAELAGVNLSRAVARIQVGKHLSADFLVWLFRSSAFAHYVDLTCVGTAQRVLNMGDLTRFLITCPPLHEQQAIVTYLCGETQALDSLIRSCSEAVALLHERRAALISAAVTGKIDVRGLVDAEAVAA